MLLPLLLAPILLVSMTPQSDAARAKNDALAARLDDYLQRSTAFGFSGSVLVAAGDRVILSKGYGPADRKTGAPCTPQTLFDLGSLSKQFTATTVLALEQAKVLRVEDTLAKFFDEVPADKRLITVHHLLTHTSGLPRGLPTVGSRSGERDAFVRAVMAAPLATKPGERHAYSNAGYELLAAVVERATGRPFEGVVNELLFNPAGMQSTGFRRDGRFDGARAARGAPDGGELAPPASFWAGNPNRFEGAGDERLLATDGWYSWGLRGAGGVLSTVEDLWLWEQALRGDRILQDGARRKLFTPFREKYAYGWYVMDAEPGGRQITHGGSTGNGFDVYLTRLPDQDQFLVTLSNVPGIVPWLHQNLVRLLAGEAVALPPAAAILGAAQLAGPAGDFKASTGGVFRVTVQDGAWVLEARDADAFALLCGAGPGQAHALVRRSSEIVKGFGGSNFAALHAAESKAQPLGWMESWWRSMLDRQGALRGALVLGAVGSDTSASVIVSLEFERGIELLTLQWSAEILTGLNIGPPYPARVRLVPISDAKALAHDLATGGNSVSIQFRADGKSAELEVQGKKSRLKRSD